MEEVYQPENIEPKVQTHWKQNRSFVVTEDSNQEKYYCLSMMPYPSGNLHIGHIRNYTIGDVISRYQRLLGKNVLQPMGWDAFGLPAEQAAIQHHISPKTWTYANIKKMKDQLQLLGCAYDWTRELITCQSDYYRWEQWFFIILYKRGLVYKKKSLVNWCPKDQTVLANEQVINKRCWRCNTKIKHKNIPQWFIKITNYADQLLYGLDTLPDWPNQVKLMQKNWIGRSDGIEITFNIVNSIQTITIYTTRPDTFMGVTYLVISVKHPLSLFVANSNKKFKKIVQEYQKMYGVYNDDTNTLEIQGIFTGMYAVHPFNNKILQIWMSNSISMEYGTGAIMGVPAHDKEDWKFAQKYSLPIQPVILDKNNCIPNIRTQPMIYKGILFNSGEFNGLDNKTACNIISKKLIENGFAKQKVNYRLRDWNISRQRYWGTPIPMITLQNGHIIPVPNDQLPVLLPDYIIKNYNVSDNPLKNDWRHIKYKKILALRESDTFDTFMESSWYYARYTCPQYKDSMLCSNAANYWLPIDQYIGGIEHATMHLMYFRFYHKLMRDYGLINSDEPAKRLLCQGMVLADAFFYFNDEHEQIWISKSNIKKIQRDNKGNIIQAIDSRGRNLTHVGMIKMSKSKNNGVDPNIIIKKYGADTLRLFIMFAAPPHMPLEWTEFGLEGIHRFLKRFWKLVYTYITKEKPKQLNICELNNEQKYFRNKIHKTILKVTDDIDRRQMFNTAIAAIMELINDLIVYLKKENKNYLLIHEAFLSIVRMLYPFTPHIAFVLWKELGGKEDIDYAEWPIADQKALIEHEKHIIIQINGKFKYKLLVSNDMSKHEIQNSLLQNTFFIKYLKGKKIIKIIYIPNKLMNFVI